MGYGFIQTAPADSISGYPLLLPHTPANLINHSPYPPPLLPSSALLSQAACLHSSYTAKSNLNLSKLAPFQSNQSSPLRYFSRSRRSVELIDGLQTRDLTIQKILAHSRQVNRFNFYIIKVLLMYLKRESRNDPYTTQRRSHKHSYNPDPSPSVSINRDQNMRVQRPSRVAEHKSADKHPFAQSNRWSALSDAYSSQAKYNERGYCGNQYSFVFSPEKRKQSFGEQSMIRNHFDRRINQNSSSSVLKAGLSQSRNRVKTEAFDQENYSIYGRRYAQETKSPEKYRVSEQRFVVLEEENRVLGNKLRRAETLIHKLEDDIIDMKEQRYEEQKISRKDQYARKYPDFDTNAPSQGWYKNFQSICRELQSVRKENDHLRREISRLGRDNYGQNDESKEISDLRLEIERLASQNKRTQEERAHYKRKYKEMQDENSRLRLQASRRMKSDSQRNKGAYQSFNIRTVLQSSNESSCATTTQHLEQPKNKRSSRSNLCMDQINNMLMRS